MSKESKSTIYSAELRKDQWDLILMALEHIRQMANGASSAYAIDTLGRKFLKRCVEETTNDIGAQVPSE